MVLPGAGKTTISNYLCAELERKGIRVVTADTYLNEYNSGKKYGKVLITMVRITIFIF